MSATVGSSAGNDNQAALEEQRRKQQEEAQNKEQENSAVDSSTKTENESTDSKVANSQNTNSTNNKDSRTLATLRPGSAGDDNIITQTNNTSQRDSENSSTTSQNDSSNLSIEELSKHINQELGKLAERIDSNPANPDNNPNSTAEHLAERPDTMAFAARQVRVETARNRQEQIQLEDDRQAQAAYQEIKSHAEKLLEAGKESQAHELLRQVKDQPQGLISLASEIKAEKFSPGTINIKLITSLKFGDTEETNETQIAQFAQMTEDQKQTRTIELMAGLVENLDRSSQDFVTNEHLIHALSESAQNPRNHFNPRNDSFGFGLSDRANPLELQISLPDTAAAPSTNISDEAKSVMQRLGVNPNHNQITEELETREAYRKTLILERENLLTAQANMMKLTQSGNASQIHLLFDGQGKPLSQETLFERASYNSGLPDEVESQYRDLKEFLQRDNNFENSTTRLSESLLGLSNEEQIVRAREIIERQIRSQQETLSLIRSTDHDLAETVLGDKSTAMERLTAVDQALIGDMTRKTLAKRANALFELHDQLTQSANSENYTEGRKSLDEFRRGVDNRTYTYQENNLSEYELLNRDLARTPEETKIIQARITALEERFEQEKDEAIGRVRGDHSNISKDLKEVQSIRGFKPLGFYQSSAWRDLAGEDETLIDRIESTQKHSGNILDTLLEQQADINDAKARMVKSGQLERYEKELKEALGDTRIGLLEAGGEFQSDLSRIARDLRGVDNFLGNAEASVKFARNAAIITAATLATGGTATSLVASGWGMTGAGFAAFGVGTTTGTGIGFLTNVADGLSRHGHGFENPYSNISSRTWQDFKTSATTAGAMAMGQGVTKSLMQVYKWGRLSAAMTGGGVGGFTSTQINYGFQLGERGGQVDEKFFKQYLKDTIFNTAGGMLGGGIGGKFGQWQDASSSLVSKLALITAEETSSVAADLLLAIGRDGEITPEGLAQSFQSVLIGRMSAHYANQGMRGPVNESAQNIRNQNLEIRVNDDLPDGVQAQTRVRVAPDGTRTVKVDASSSTLRSAADGDADAQKTMIEETMGHGRENPIDPQVRQADGKYKNMSPEQYHALRARQELIQRSVAESVHAQRQGESVSSTKQESKTVLAEMTEQIRAGNYDEAMRIAEANGVGESYKQRYSADYEYNTNRNRETDALEQTSFHHDDNPHSKIDTSGSERLIEEQLGENLRSIEDVQAVRDLLDDLDPQVRDAVSEALSTQEQRLVTEELDQAIELISTNPGILRDDYQSSRIQNLLENAKSGQAQVTENHQKLGELSSDTALKGKTATELEALNSRVENMSAHERLAFRAEAKRLQLQELINVQQRINTEEAKAKTDPNKKQNLDLLNQQKKDILARETENSKNSNTVKTAQDAVKAKLRESGSWKQLELELKAMDPKIRDAAYELISEKSKTMISPVQVQEAHRIAQYLDSVKGMDNFDQYLNNIRQLQNEFPDILLRTDMENFKQFKSEDNNPGSLNEKMQGVFAERNVLLRDLKAGNNSSASNGTGVLVHKIIDSNGNKVATIDELFHPKDTNHGLSLKRRDATSNEVLDADGQVITVRNGSNQTSPLIIKDGEFYAGGKPATIVYDTQTGKYIAREVDLVTSGKLGNDTKDQSYLQEVKNAASTMRNKYNSDNGRQFRALLALSQEQGATATIRINQAKSTLTNSRSSNGFSKDDYKAYNEMLDIAAARNQRLIFADEDGNILNDNIRANK